jgi:thiol-disulfide isomerase/thioredoxin
MRDTDGVVRNSHEWNGKILIVNFWASWCPPCLEEMPALIEIQNRYAPQGVQVLGVAIDDPEQARAFMQTQDVNFPVIIGVDDAMDLGKRMGNRISTLPYTAIFDQTGKTIYAQPGKISKIYLEQTIKPLL